MNRLTIYLLALGAFVTGTAEMVVAGILNVIADDLRISVGLAGQLITAFSLSFAIGTPILISLTSRMERKKLLVLSLIVFIAGCLLSFLSSEYTVLFISRIILGLSAGIFGVVAISSAAKLVPAEKMGSAIGVIALGFGSAMALGVPIGITVSNLWSWQMIFAGLAVVSLLVILALVWLLPQIEGDSPVPFKQQFYVLKNPVIVSGLFLSLFMCMSNSVMLTYLTPFLQDILHLNGSNIAFMMVLLGVIGIIGSQFGGHGVDKWGTVRMISYGLIISAIALALIPALTASLVAGLTLITIWMATIFIVAPALQSYFIQQAPSSSNLVLSLNTSIIHLGLAIGAGAGGLLVNSTSTVLYNPWVASLAVLIGFVLAIISFTIRKRKYSRTAV